MEEMKQSEQPQSVRYCLYLLEQENGRKVPSGCCEIKSFYQNVGDAIHTDHTTDEKVYEFFGIHYLLCTDDSEEKKKELKDKGYKELHKIIDIRQEVLDQENISRKLRNSSTLQLSEKNSMITGHHNRITFDANGICVNYHSNSNSKFATENLVSDTNKAIYCYLLALAYNEKAERLLMQATRSFASGNDEEMIKCRDDVYAFDLKYFFRNPVQREVFETHALWNLAARFCEVQENHDEIKGQVAELANVIESRQRDRENKRQLRNSWILQVVGALVALASLVSVIKDARELFGC